MAIDTSGKWWKGENIEDVATFLRLLMADSYPVGEVHQSVCSCKNQEFSLKVDRNMGCAQRICIACHQSVFIGDSGENWQEAHPRIVHCPCKNPTFEIGVGFSFRGDQDEIRWITVGTRCTKCGILGSPVDWQIYYGPSMHLVELV
jgi:hypothetical protein